MKQIQAHSFIKYTLGISTLTAILTGVLGNTSVRVTLSRGRQRKACIPKETQVSARCPLRLRLLIFV